MENTKQFYLKYRLIINLYIVTILLLLNCFWGFFSYIVFPIAAILVLFDDLKNGFSYIVFLLPFRLINVNTSAMLYFVVVGVFVIKLFVKVFIKEKQKINLPIAILLIVLTIYCLLPFGKYNYNFLIKICSVLFIVLLLILVSKKSEVFRANFNIRLLAISLLVSCVMGLTFFVSPHLQTITFLRYTGDNIVRYQALLTQPNGLSMLSEIVVAMLAMLIIQFKGRWYDVLLLILTIVAGATTLSKTYLLLVLLVLIAIYIWCMKSNWKKTSIISLILLLLVGMAFVFAPKLFILMYNRFFGGIANCKSFADFMNMITTGRYDLWCETLSYLAHNPLKLVFGSGLGAPVLSSLSAHNTFISMVYQLGVVGGALLIALLVLIVKELVKNCKIHKSIYILLAVTVGILMVEDTIFYIYKI